MGVSTSKTILNEAEKKNKKQHTDILDRFDESSASSSHPSLQHIKIENHFQSFIYFFYSLCCLLTMVVKP